MQQKNGTRPEGLSPGEEQTCLFCSRAVHPITPWASLGRWSDPSRPGARILQRVLMGTRLELGVVKRIRKACLPPEGAGSKPARDELGRHKCHNFYSSTHSLTMKPVGKYCQLGTRRAFVCVRFKLSFLWTCMQRGDRTLHAHCDDVTRGTLVRFHAGRDTELRPRPRSCLLPHPHQQIAEYILG